MLINFPRQLFDKQWFEESIPQLKRSFDEFTPRSAYLSDKKNIERINKLSLSQHEQPNIVSYPTRFCNQKTSGIESFDIIFQKNSGYKLMKEKFDTIENYLSQYIESANTSFLTFSTNITDAQLGVKHLHPLLNKDKCNVWSFCIPLYIDSEHLDKCPQFWYTSQNELFPTRWYLDYDRIKSRNFDYGNFTIPLSDKVFSIRFDGSRSPHYIDYKPHVFVWLVIDGVIYKDVSYAQKGIQFITELL